jgi:uncharacterized membrane protein
MQTAQRFVTQATPQAVWRILEDVESWPQWTPTVLKVKPLGNGGLRVGAKYLVTQPKLRPAIYEITDCIPGRAFTWAQRMPGAALIADHRIIPNGSDTEVELSFRSEGLLANVVAKFFSKIISEYVATEARSLKARCDATGADANNLPGREPMFSGRS